MNILIVGGTSGLGLEMGKLLLSSSESKIYVTGRSSGKTPPELNFIEFTITESVTELAETLDKTIASLPAIHLLIYSAGFIEKGHIAELSDNHISQMINVGFSAPALILQRIIKKQDSLSGFIAVTSTSQWIPRELEPVYSGVKSGLAMLAHSVSFDPKVGKTLVVGPTGMNTDFWTGSDRDLNDLLLPEVVASQIIELWKDTYTYRLARILRSPIPESERVQIIETRL